MAAHLGTNGIHLGRNIRRRVPNGVQGVRLGGRCCIRSFCGCWIRLCAEITGTGGFPGFPGFNFVY